MESPCRNLMKGKSWWNLMKERFLEESHKGKVLGGTS